MMCVRCNRNLPKPEVPLARVHPISGETTTKQKCVDYHQPEGGKGLRAPSVVGLLGSVHKGEVAENYGPFMPPSTLHHRDILMELLQCCTVSPTFADYIVTARLSTIEFGEVNVEGIAPWLLLHQRHLGQAHGLK